MVETKTTSPTNWKLRLVDVRDPWNRWAGDLIYWTPDCQRCPFHFVWQYESGGKANTCEWGVVYKNLIRPSFATHQNFRACAKRKKASPRVVKARQSNDRTEGGDDGGQPGQPVFPEFVEVMKGGGDIFTSVLGSEQSTKI